MTEQERIAAIRKTGKMNAFEKARYKYEKHKKNNDAYKEGVKEAAKAEAELSKALRKSEIRITILEPNGEFVYVFDAPYLTGTRLGSQRTKEAYRELLDRFVQKEFGKCRLI